MRRTNFYLDPDKLRALKVFAASESVSVSDLVREAIDQIINKRLAKAKAASGNGSNATLLDQVLQRIDAARPTDISDDEIERDIIDAADQVRVERAARRRSVTSGPTAE